VQRFEEEAFSRLGIPRRAQENGEGVPKGIDRPVEVHPRYADFDGGLVHFPGVIAGCRDEGDNVCPVLGQSAAPNEREWYGRRSRPRSAIISSRSR
jgi:hypothetical protein